MKKLLLILFLLTPFNAYSVSEYAKLFIYIECDKVAKRLHIEERTVWGKNNYIKLEQRHPNYFLQYGGIKEGKCDIGSREITWTIWGKKVYIDVDGKPWVDAIRVNTFRQLVMSFGEENQLGLYMRMKPGVINYSSVPVEPSKKYYNSDYVVHEEYEK
ncbi:MAG: hypothetical protein ACPG8V_04475 [Alphaproteobacteria bacterium]